jgi:hypothetical protein
VKAAAGASLPSATVGDFHTDERFAENWQGPRQPGFPLRWPRPAAGRPGTQIDRFERVIGWRGRPAARADVEVDGGQTNATIRAHTERPQPGDARFAQAFGTPLTGSDPVIGSVDWADDHTWVARLPLARGHRRSTPPADELERSAALQQGSGAVDLGQFRPNFGDDG